MRSYSFSKLLVLTTTGVLLLLAGCDQQSAMKAPTDSEKSGDPTPTAQEKKLNNALDAMARDVAAALENQSVRSLVKHQTGELLAGQHNVLFQTLADKTVKGLSKSGQSTTFEQVLAQKRAGSAKSGKSLKQALTSVRTDAKAIPKFDIGVPVHHEKWNPGETTPLVAFHHRQEIDDTKLEKIKAYDAQGNVHWLDAQETPDQPLVVVGVNERTTDDGEVRTMYQRLPQPICASPRSKCGGDGGTGGGGGGSGGGSSESLEYGDEVYLWKVKVNKDKEPPWKGDPEIVFKAKNKNGTLLHEYRHEKRNGSDMSFWDNSDDKIWISHNVNFYKWEKKFGSPVGWGAYEYDPGNLTLSFNAGPISISYSNDSDKYGGTGVQIGDEVEDKDNPIKLGGQKFVLKTE
jgi:hypothetical protein